MGVTDFIADQLTVIRNAIMVGKKTVMVKRSKVLEKMIGIMKTESFIEDYKLVEDKQQGKIKVYLKTTGDGTSAIEKIEKVSTPGRRLYVPVKEVKEIRGGIGIAILSTNKGIMTDSEARKLGIGGELLCRIW